MAIKSTLCEETVTNCWPVCQSFDSLSKFIDVQIINWLHGSIIIVHAMSGYLIKQSSCNLCLTLAACWLPRDLEQVAPDEDPRLSQQWDTFCHLLPIVATHQTIGSHVVCVCVCGCTYFYLILPSYSNTNFDIIFFCFFCNFCNEL